MEKMDHKANKLITLGVVLWVSFLSAAVAAMLFFATFDPVDLGDIATFPLSLDRMGGYSVGFLLFWLLLAVNSLAVIWLARRPNEPREH
ncbi:hypothetical protein N8855_00555 [bacterium]|nr:hypothetical protein [bacterium]